MSKRQYPKASSPELILKTSFEKFSGHHKDVLTGLIMNLYKEDPGAKKMTLRKINNTINTLTKHPDKGTIMIAKHEGKVIGYAILINFWSNEFGGNIVIIDEIYITKAFRSKGIGTNLIRHLISEKFAGCVALQLEVTPGNIKARKLYESLGFRLHKNAMLTLQLK